MREYSVHIKSTHSKASSNVRGVYYILSLSTPFDLQGIHLQSLECLDLDVIGILNISKDYVVYFSLHFFLESLEICFPNVLFILHAFL